MTTTQPRTISTGWGLGLFATFCFSIAPPTASAAIAGGQNPTAILVVRMALTMLLLVVTIALMDARLLRTDRRCLQVSLLAGLTNSAGMVGYFWALTRLHTSVAAMLFSVSPLVVLSVLALRGEPVTRRHVLRLALALGGIYLLVGPSGAVDLLGLLYLSVAIVAFALQVVFIQWFLTGYDARTVTLYMAVGMALGVTIFWFFQGAPWVVPSLGGWVAILVLAVMSTYLARLAFFGAISRIGGAQVAMLTPLEILMTILWSVLFLGERLTLVQWLGGLLILSSALLAVQRLGRVRRPLRWRLWARA
jgi:drug/metabolite transporter (DMT)-like permease